MKSPTKAFYATGMVAVFLLGALIVMPGAQAQQFKPTLSLTVDSISAPLVPIQDTGELDINWVYSLNNQAQNLFSVTGSITVDVVVNCGSNVILSGDSSAVFQIDTAPGTAAFSADGTITKQVTIKREATALEPISCTISGSASGLNEQGLPSPDDYNTQTSVKPAYFSSLEAKSSGAKLRQGGPQKQIPFEIDVKNFGNGQTKVRFEVVERPGNKDWQALPPDVMLLDAKDGANANGIATFTVSTPYKNGWNNEEGGFLLRLTPEYNFDSNNKGGPVDVQILARVRGVYVPSLEPLVMLGAVLGSAMLARMLRSDE